jgi:hypothetical protein
MINRRINYLELNWRMLVSWGIIAGLIVASMLVSPFAAMGRLPFRQIVMLYLGICSVIVLIRFPNLGLIFLIIASMIVPFNLNMGSNSSINVSMLLVVLLVGLWILDMLVKQRKITLLSSKTIMPGIIFCAVAVISFGFGQLGWFHARGAPLPTQIAQLSLFILSIAGFLLVAHQLKDIRNLEWMVWIFIAIGGLSVAARMIPALGGMMMPLFQRGVFDSLFWTWLISLSYSQLLINRQLKLIWKGLLLALLLAALYLNVVVHMDWSSGWVPGIAAIGLITWFGAPQLRRQVVLVLLVAAAFKYESIISIIMVGDNEYSLMTRFEAWRVLGEVIRANPLFGVGPANYYWFSALFPILGYYVPFNSHNNYVDILAQMGLVGLVVFIWFTVELGRVGMRLRQAIPEGFPRAYVYACIGGLGGMVVAGMLGDWLIPFVYNVGLAGFRASILGWMFLGGLIAMENMYLNKDSDSANHDLAITE